MRKTSRRLRTVMLSALAALSIALPAALSRPEQDQGKAAPGEAILNPDRAEDEQAIRALRSGFRKSFDAGDAAKLAALFTEDAELIDESGLSHSGREAIQDRFASAFAEAPGSKLSLEFVSLRFIGPNAAVERGKSTVTDAEPALDTPTADAYTAVYSKQAGRWLIAELEDHPAVEVVASVSNHDKLKSLEWMLGEWVSEQADSLHSASFRWDEHKNYLLQEFTVRTGGQVVLSGTQRIGWDAARKSIRSWIFDDEGGFGEGTWSRDEQGRWTIKVSGQNRDGLSISATRIITILDPHRVTWTSVDRSVGGEAVGDIDEFVMVRKPPTPTRVGAAGGPGR